MTPVLEKDSPDWPPSDATSLLDVMLAALARLDAIGVTPWNMWVEPPRRVMLTLHEAPSDALAHRIDNALEPLEVATHWYEASVEVRDYASDLDDSDEDDLGSDVPGACGVCGGPGPLRECRLDPSARPKQRLMIASTWQICLACLAAIATSDPDAVRSRLRPETRTSSYAEALVESLLEGIRLAP